jgi:tripartite-type tricarboxylate transporter receptor subunit TctC
MKLPRRKFLRLAAGAAALPAVSSIARAQAYPSQPARIIVGFPAGGTNDTWARLVAQWLSERLGQQFIVENRVGAGGNLGTEAVVRAPPDGYTLLLVSSADAWNMSLYDNLNFNFIRDITPVAGTHRGPAVLVVHPSFPAKTVPELIAYAKANPGKINMASGGIGTMQQVSGELFKSMAGVDMLHVPYRGGAPALADLLSGQVHLMFEPISTSIEHIRQGKLRPLGVTGAQRSAALPDIPAIGEVVSGYEAFGWAGIGAPKNTPAEIVDRLNKEINAALADPRTRLRARMEDVSVVPMPMTPTDFGRFIAEYTEKWSKVIRAANIKL